MISKEKKAEIIAKYGRSRRYRFTRSSDRYPYRENHRTDCSSSAESKGSSFQKRTPDDGWTQKRTS